jgi:hypothetical protein
MRMKEEIKCPVISQCDSAGDSPYFFSLSVLHHTHRKEGKDSGMYTLSSCPHCSWERQNHRKDEGKPQSSSRNSEQKKSHEAQVQEDLPVGGP